MCAGVHSLGWVLLLYLEMFQKNDQQQKCVKWSLSRSPSELER